MTGPSTTGAATTGAATAGAAAPGAAGAGAAAWGRAVVIGVGNTWRGDDGVGVAVVERLDARLGAASGGRPCGSPADRWPGGIDVVALDGEPSRLLDAWDGAALAVVVDAVAAVGGPPAGSLVVWDGLGADAAPVTSGASPSSHGLGVAEAVALGRALDRLPTALVVVGVVGAAFDDGTGLSAPVAGAVDRAVTTVLEALAPDLGAGPLEQPGERPTDRPTERLVEPHRPQPSGPPGDPQRELPEAVAATAAIAADHRGGGDHVSR